MEKKKIFEITEEAAQAIRIALGKLPHDTVNPIIAFFEKNLVLQQDKVEEVKTQ